jgi:hypothetical protein
MDIASKKRNTIVIHPGNFQSLMRLFKIIKNYQEIFFSGQVLLSLTLNLLHYSQKRERMYAPKTIAFYWLFTPFKLAQHTSECTYESTSTTFISHLHTSSYYSLCFSLIQVSSIKTWIARKSISLLLIQEANFKFPFSTEN